MERDWTKSIVGRDAFQHEQERLENVWTFLGLTVDVPNDGDWFTCTIATRSVFVQRFGAVLHGFENLCVHRFYPLRRGARGNGPLICGYHNWQYDSDGRVVGIPRARELFGALPQELGARLRKIELATCGTLVFGRFAGARNDSLEDFLADGFDILQATSLVSGRCQFLTGTIEANWRLCMHISLDDYHGVAVHPSTFGKGGYLKRSDIGYFRFGLHSAYLDTHKPDAFETMRVACRAGSFLPTRYTIFQVVPNMLLAIFRVHREAFYAVVETFEPIRHDACRLKAWLYPASFGAPRSWLRRLTELVHGPIVRHYAQRVFREDNRVCEHLQQVASQIQTIPRLGALEERIEWFEASYRQLVSEANRAGP
jgi:phenylpropionate dioxygenase-like ring-hydroxylating dioxygenase large terminal subunit